MAHPEPMGSSSFSAAAPQSITVSIFSNLHAASAERVTVKWSDLPRFLVEDTERKAADKKKLRLFIPGAFDGSTTPKGSIRHDDGLVYLDALVLDYDEGKVSMEEAGELFNRMGCSAIVAPTASWSKDVHKWRAILPLSRRHSVHDDDDLKSLHKSWVHTVRTWGLNVSGETDTLSQSYYFGLPTGKMAPAPITVYGARYVDRVARTPPPTLDAPRGSFLSERESLELLETVSTGAPGVHEAMRRLSMAWISRGLDPGTVRALLKQALEKWGRPGDERWEDRRASVDRLVDGAVRRVMAEKMAGGDEEVNPVEVEAYTDRLPSLTEARFTLEELGKEPDPEVMVVPGYLIGAESGGLVAPGGTGKTTLAIWEAVHLALGLDLYGFPVQQPGPVLFISAEDRREIILRRLHSIVRGMNLSKTQMQKLVQDFLVVDVSRMRFRLAARNKFDVGPTPWVDALATKYGKLKPCYIHLDPVSLIGPGEEAGNDGMAELMRASRNLGALTGAAVRLIHHTSKEVARGATVDQYVGRGGSAFADNARFVHQLSPLGMQGAEEITVRGVRYLVPPELGATEEDIMRGRVLGLYRHKISYAELDSTPIFIKRNGFKFEWAMGVAEVTEEGRAMAEVRTAERQVEQSSRLMEFLKTFGEAGVLRRNLERNDFARFSTKREAPSLLDSMVANGRIEQFSQAGPSGGRPQVFIRVKAEE